MKVSHFCSLVGVLVGAFLGYRIGQVLDDRHTRTVNDDTRLQYGDGEMAEAVR